MYSRYQCQPARFGEALASLVAREERRSPQRRAAVRSAARQSLPLDVEISQATAVAWHLRQTRRQAGEEQTA